MDRFMHDLPALIIGLLGAILVFSTIYAVLRTGQKTAETADELRKTNAILLEAFGLEVTRSAQGGVEVVTRSTRAPEQFEFGGTANVTCGLCGGPFRVDDAALGHTARCPHCKKIVVTKRPQAPTPSAPA